LDALGTIVRDLLTAVAEEPPAKVTVVLPAHAHMTVTAVVNSALTAMGVGEVHVVSDAIATLKATATSVAPGHWGLVISVGAVETRAVLVQGPDAVAGVRCAVDASLYDADDLLVDRAAVQLLREQSVDVADDPSLRADLMQQVTHARRSTKAGLPWPVAVAGAELSLTPAILAGWCEPLSERVALLADMLLHEHGVPPQTLKTVLLVPDEPVWPGLLDALESALGVRPLVSADGPTTRLKGG